MFYKDTILHSPSGKYAKLFSTLIIRTLLHKFQDVHGSVKVATGQANANSCLMFVPGQDPNFDPRLPQSFDGLLDLVLEPELRNKEKMHLVYKVCCEINILHI